MRSGRPLKGAVLISVLVIALVFVLLGISVVGVETSQIRYSAWKYNKAVTNQAAAAAIRKVEYQLSTQTNWTANCIDVSERRVEGNNCYYKVDVNECSKCYCTVTTHAYLKDPAGNRKWESSIRVTLRKNYFDYAALGACTGGTEGVPGVTVKDDSVVDGDVGSFKPANTVAVEIGTSSPVAASGSSLNPSNPSNPSAPYPLPAIIPNQIQPIQAHLNHRVQLIRLLPQCLKKLLPIPAREIRSTLPPCQNQTRAEK